MKTTLRIPRAIRWASLLVLAGWAGLSQAQTVYYSAADLNLELPDGGGLGIFVQQTVSGLSGPIAAVTVALKISGTWSGDLYAYLNFGDAHAVLLNRAGKTEAHPAGYGDRGFDVRFDDQALNGDIHTYRIAYGGAPPLNASGALTGDWAPDGRESDPDAVLDTDFRTATLSVFEGKNPNGQWTLFVADMAAGSVHRLEAWELGIHLIPEPGALGWAMGGMSLLWLALSRRPRKGRVP